MNRGLTVLAVQQTFSKAQGRPLTDKVIGVLTCYLFVFLLVCFFFYFCFLFFFFISVQFVLLIIFDNCGRILMLQIDVGLILTSTSIHLLNSFFYFLGEMSVSCPGMVCWVPPSFLFSGWRCDGWQCD